MQWLWIWGPALLQMAAIFTLSNQPRLPSLPGGLTGYTGHFIGYFILAVAFVRGFARGRLSGVTPAAGAAAWMASAVYGVSDEFHQRFVPGRNASIEDWVADVAGAAVGVAVAFAWRSRRESGSRAV
jgi:VanZ family protein